MRLDRYDAGATLATAVAGAAFWGHAVDYGVLSGTRTTAGVVLLAGVAACAANGSRPGMTTESRFASLMSVLGVAAFVCGLAALVLGREAALVALAVVTGGLWLVTTVKHVVAGPTVTSYATPAERPLERVH